VLQELGGFENAFAERAAAAAREAADSEAARERAELEQTHSEALENVGRGAARDAIERLAVRLLSPDGAAAGAPASDAVVPSAPETPAPVPAAVSEARVEAEEEPLAVDGPSLDTILCTSCNECTNINARLFAYDDNKQAFIADASAGSFAELVKAAKLCPARCIHPGRPRKGDASATPALIAAAAEFD
jgi:ferredoxin